MAGAGEVVERHGRPQAPAPPGHGGYGLAELYDRHRLFHVRLALLLVDDRETAEDVVQDAFASLQRKFGDRVEDVGHELAYLRAAVVNAARSALRRRRTAARHVPPHSVAAASAEVAFMESEERRQVALALRRLPSRQREVVVLRYWAGLSEAEIAATMGIAAGTVKSTAAKALAALKQAMEGQ